MIERRRALGKVLILTLALVAPLAIISVAMGWSVGPLARRGATMLRAFGARVPAPSFAASALDAPSRSEDSPGDVFASVDREVSPRELVRPSRKTISARRNGRRIFVGPDMVRRALPPQARPVAGWVAASDGRPAGMLVSSPGALAGTIQAGDVVFEAEGRALASFEQLVAIVGRAYGQRAKFVSGRLWRRGEVWSVTVEPGWITETANAGH
jgi:hypothetical protein